MFHFEEWSVRLFLILKISIWFMLFLPLILLNVIKLWQVKKMLKIWKKKFKMYCLKDCSSLECAYSAPQSFILILMIQSHMELRADMGYSSLHRLMHMEWNMSHHQIRRQLLECMQLPQVEPNAPNTSRRSTQWQRKLF